MAKKYRIFLGDEIGEEIKRLMTITMEHELPAMIIKTVDGRIYHQVHLLPFASKIMSNGTRIGMILAPFNDGTIFTWLAKDEKIMVGDGIIIKELQVQ